MYSFQFFLSLRAITLALHRVKLPLQSYRYPIRPMSLPTKPPGPPTIRVAALWWLETRKWGSRLCNLEDLHGCIGEVNEPASFLQPSVEQVTSPIGKN